MVPDEHPGETHGEYPIWCGHDTFVQREPSELSNACFSYIPAILDIHGRTEFMFENWWVSQINGHIPLNQLAIS